MGEVTKEMREPYPHDEPWFEFDGALELNGVMMQVDRPLPLRFLSGLSTEALAIVTKSPAVTEVDRVYRSAAERELRWRENRIDRVIELLEQINDRLTK